MSMRLGADHSDRSSCSLILTYTFLFLSQPSSKTNSAKSPRKALNVSVRCQIRRSRSRKITPSLCCSGVFTSTVRMVGRLVASALASASAMSLC